MLFFVVVSPASDDIVTVPVSAFAVTLVDPSPLIVSVAPGLVAPITYVSSVPSTGTPILLKNVRLSISANIPVASTAGTYPGCPDSPTAGLAGCPIFSSVWSFSIILLSPSASSRLAFEVPNHLPCANITLPPKICGSSGIYSVALPVGQGNLLS